MLKRHSHRPRLSPADGALLIVNRESRQVFLKHYTRAFHDYGLPGIYINYALDTLFLNRSSKALRLLLKQYPKTMRRIQRLETRNCHQLWEPSFGDIDFSLMPSLQSFAVTWRPQFEFQYYPLIRFEPDETLKDTITYAKHALGSSNYYTSECLPKLFAIISTEDTTWKFPDEEEKAGRKYIVRDASASNWKLFKSDIPETWKRKYPEQDTLDLGWFPCEVK